MALFLFLRRSGGPVGGLVVHVWHIFIVHLIVLLLLAAAGLPALNIIPKANAVANVKISELDLKFALLPSSNLIILPHDETELLLPCLVSFGDAAVARVPNYDMEYPFHVWLRNNEPVVLRDKEFELFNNGTLRIFPSDKTTGSYRCLVNGTTIDGLGILISSETKVQIAVNKRRELTSNVNTTALIGQPIVLPCPIQSVPKANISWYFGNKNTNSNSRFLILENGGLLIKSALKSDQGKFKCLSQNRYAAKTNRQISRTLVVREARDLAQRERKGLLPALQNETIYIKSGATLRLHCASYTEEIYWLFTSRFQPDHSFLISNSTVEVLVRNVSAEEHDGWYRCSSNSDSQVFNVFVTTPPVITTPLENWESSVAAQVSFNCNATGNPPPSITWYRNGIRLENDLRIHYTPHTLTIYSIDLDEGIYQCFARNAAGEAFSTGRLMLRRKDNLPNMPKRPENISCYPVSYDTVLVTFARNAALSFITPHAVTTDPFDWKTKMPVHLLSKTNFTLSDVPRLRPFTLYLRGMVPTSTQKTIKGEHHTFDTSLLSEGAICGTQGMRVNTVLLQAGIFIFWSPFDLVKAKYFRIQFWNNSTKNALLFPDTVVATTQSIDLQRTTKDDINRWLVKMPVLNRTITSSSMSSSNEAAGTEARNKRSIIGGGGTEGGKQNFKNAKNAEKRDKDGGTEVDGGLGGVLTEVRVPGNVTGILIPNVQHIRVRVLVITTENENLNLDLRYVEWEMVSSVHESGIIFENHNFDFRIMENESRSIAVSWNPLASITCIKVCYFVNMLEARIRQNNQQTCQNIYDVDWFFEIRKLSPATIYHMNFYDCTNLQEFGMLDVKTSRDVPGPVTNQLIVKNDGYKLKWEPPINPNGDILYYNIKWTAHGATHSQNISDGAKFFKFPNTTDDDKINITIRAIGTSGVGLPIFMDLKYARTADFEKTTSSFNDPLLGIIIGVILSILCILIFIWIIVRQRKRFKDRACNQNGPTLPSDSRCPQTPSSNMELREMQTLISKQPALQIVCDSINALPRNGIYYGQPPHDEETEIVENLSRAISSTPKGTRRQDVPLSDRLLHEYNAVMNGIQPPDSMAVSTQLPAVIVPTPSMVMGNCTNSTPPSVVVPSRIVSDDTVTSGTMTTTTADNTTTQLLNKNSSSPNFYISKLHSNGNSTKLQNGSIKTTLPPNKHSKQAAITEPKLAKMNGSLRNADSLQYSTDPNSNTSTNLDNSRHKLLDTKLDSSSTISQLNDTTKNHRNNNHRPPLLMSRQPNNVVQNNHHQPQQNHRPNHNHHQETNNHHHHPPHNHHLHNGDNSHDSLLSDCDDETTTTTIGSPSSLDRTSTTLLADDSNSSSIATNLNSSCNPLLLKAASWNNYRRPIVEPNG